MHIIQKVKVLSVNFAIAVCYGLKCFFFQSWYGCSDYEIEDKLKDSISFSYFCGMNIDEVAPYFRALSDLELY
jgi:hypothetical protein